ncbi:MAG TPA: hypothetical protein VIV60_34405 [Polyangiaceae bacterium]
MRKPIVHGLQWVATFTLASTAQAATMYVSPTGTATTDCTRATPCDLTSAVAAVTAGDTVILMDGIYKGKPLNPVANGTSSAWITFQADECATPIIEGEGTDDQNTGVGSPNALDKGSYIRYVGLVSRGWNTGFGNHWVNTDATPPEAPPSNGNVEYKYCIGEGNGRTGFTHYSASGIHIQNCISAHNGSSVAHSWSSGMTLYATSKGTGSALIEGSVSFENMDAEQHTDGSGFIVDEESNNATFVNNLAFRNGGSCLRLTKSSNTKFINNTCYHNAMDTKDQGPDNPGEMYFTDAPTRDGVSMSNNVLVATGSGPGASAVFGQPTSGWNNNQVTTGSVAFFAAPDGNNPDFTLASNSALAGKGSNGSGVPTSDIGFDPKCITKKTPTMIGSIAKGDWWQYSVDIDYIKSIGGVAACFRPKTRTGTPDIGAYANGAVTAAAVCKPPGTGGAPSSGGSSGVAGAPSNGGTTANAGGAPGTVGGSSSTNVGNAGGTSAGGTSATGSSANRGGTNSSGGTKADTTNAGGDTSRGGTATSMGGSKSAAGGTSNSSSSANGGTTTSAPSSNNSGGSTNASSSTSNGTATSNSSGGATTSSSRSVNAVGGSTGAAPVGDGEPSASGCGCKLADRSSHSTSLLSIGLLGLLVSRIRRRPRRSR